MSKQSQLICTVTAGFLSCAWVPVHAGVHRSIQGGASYTFLSNDGGLKSWNARGRGGLTLGFTVEVPLSARFRFVPGVRYVQQKSRVEWDTGPEVSGVQRLGNLRTSQDYMSLPLLLKIQINGTPGPFFVLGPEVGYLVRAHLEGDEYEQSAGEEGFRKTEWDDSISDRMRCTTFLLDVGVGIEHPAKNLVRTVQLRYVHGLTRATEEGRLFSDWKTRSIELLIGVTW